LSYRRGGPRRAVFRGDGCWGAALSRRARAADGARGSAPPIPCPRILAGTRAAPGSQTYGSVAAATRPPLKELNVQWLLQPPFPGKRTRRTQRREFFQAAGTRVV